MNENTLILVVDDSKENRDILSRRLEVSGYQTLEAEDGLQAMELLQSNDVSIVLLDIMMPEVDGITLLSQIRNDNKFNNVPVIMVTAIDVINVAQDCLRKGACGYVTKPYDMDLINQKVRQCLEKQREAS